MTHGLGKSKGKVSVDHPLSAHQGSVSCDAKSRSARVGKVVHPCRVLIFSKSRVHGYGRLGNGRGIIENLNLIVKLGKIKCA